MKKEPIKKRVIWILSVVAVLFLAVAILIPSIKSIQHQKKAAVANAVDAIFSAYELNDHTIERAKGYMDNVIGNKTQEAAFVEQAIAEIQRMNGGVGKLSLTVYDIVLQQKLLEIIGYENDAIKQAYEAQIMVMLNLQDGLMTFDNFTEEILREPLGMRAGSFYHDQPDYYTSPQKVYIETYLPQHLDQKKAEALRTKDTGKILNLCADLAVLSQYDGLDSVNTVSIQELLILLTAEAETILIKPGVGGYYDGWEDSSSSNHDRDEAMSVVGNMVQATVSAAHYFGDLASYDFHRSESYFGEDSNGNSMQVTGESTSYTAIYLCGTKISDYDLKERYIKLAYENNMAAYHKDGYCFAVNDEQLICFVGKDHFSLDLK